MSEVQGQAIPGEQTNTDANPIVAADKEVLYETKAKELGWRPETDWEGDPTDWVPAKEFVGRQKLYDRIHSLKGELVNQGKTFAADMATIKSYVQTMSDIEYKRAVKDLTEQRKEAVRDADVDTVDRLTVELDELKDARKTAPQQAPAKQEYSQAFLQWAERNSWYQKDSELRAEADSLGVAYALQHKGQKTEQEVMDYVENKVKKMNPDKFQTAAPKAPAVEGASNGNSGVQKTGSKLSSASLTEDERRVMKTLIQRGIVTEEKYLKDLAEVKGR